ncbi:MAG: hypothetical protein KAS93_02910 [Gammaproteobacteria bacterium]|nr:hypothetical protein [Gammaproteobacteria bacterium]
MTKYEQLLTIQKRKLEKALQHLAYSYNKVQQLPEDAKLLDEEQLETWESFAARFSRVADIFLTQYLRTIILISDPGFKGTLRDQLNQAEKSSIIEDTKNWLTIREIRNITAHDYSENDLTNFFKQLKLQCPNLLKINEIISRS